MHYKREIGVILTLAAMLTVPAAQAHGLGTDGAGFLAGLSHPVLGLDHVLGMLAVGLWGAQQGGRAVWRLPLAFAGMMFVGAALAPTGLVLPAVEVGVTASVVVLGLMLAAAARTAPSASLALVGTFALFHGYAHAVEIPQMNPVFSYALGLLTTTALLQLAGIALGREFRRANGEHLLRWGGAAIACGGMLLLA